MNMMKPVPVLVHMAVSPRVLFSRNFANKILAK